MDNNDPFMANDLGLGGNPAPPPQDLGEDLGAAHQALLQGGGPTGFQPYKRPSFFAARVRFHIKISSLNNLSLLERVLLPEQRGGNKD